jgi:chromosome segregation ATPase
MTAKEWRNHTDERIAALFAAQEESNRQIQEINARLSDNILETNRLIKENSAETEAKIKLLLEAQINANQRMDRAEHRMDRAERRMDRLEENLDRVIRKVDAWLDNLQSRNGA